MPYFNPDVQNPSYARTAAFRADPPIWAVWEYTAAEWAAWDTRAWAHDRRVAWTRFRPYALLALLGVGVIVALSIAAGDLRIVMLSVVPLWLFGVGGGLNWWLRYAPAAHRHRARLHGPHTVLITPTHIVEAGRLIPLVDRQLVLRRVWLSGEADLRLHFQQTLYRRGASEWELAVPVPAGRAEEARTVVHQFQSQVI